MLRIRLVWRCKKRLLQWQKPGTACEDMYNKAIDIVTKAGFADYFMGVGQKAKFIGHGIGLEINEMPVLAPRMKQELEPGMVFALEPKIVLPDIGPVGIEIPGCNNRGLGKTDPVWRRDRRTLISD